MDKACFRQFNGYEVKDAKARASLKICSLENSRRLYVDCVNGNDNNDGLTQDTSFKTMDKFFSLANEGGTDIRCYIVSAGTYDVSYAVFSHMTFHITGNVDGIILNFTSTQPERVWYNCHINFANITLKANVDEFRFESGVVAMDNVIFDSERVNFWQCHVDCSTNVTFPRLVMFGTSGRLKNVTSTFEGNGAVSMDNGCTVRMYGTLAFPNRTTENTDSAISCVASYFTFICSEISGTGWKNGITGNASVIYMPQRVYTALSGICENTILQNSSYPAMFIKTGTVYGGDYT